jgi:hypothetical protein
MAVYIAAEKPLDLVPWSEDDPAFYVSELEGTDEKARDQFTEPYVYFAGSHEGCGCGFQYGSITDDSRSEERAARRASLESFSSYLQQQLHRVPVIRVYACWEGDQQAQVAHRRALVPSDLLSEAFVFLERELSCIRETHDTAA